jgi:hypothetical protein
MDSDPRLPVIQHRARSTYLRWFSMPLKKYTLALHLHPYLCAGARVPAPWVQSMTRLRLSSHALHVEAGCHTRPPKAYLDRACTRCSAGVVDDEYHLLIECSTTEANKQSFTDITPPDKSQPQR